MKENIFVLVPLGMFLLAGISIALSSLKRYKKENERYISAKEKATLIDVTLIKNTNARELAPRLDMVYVNESGEQIFLKCHPTKEMTLPKGYQMQVYYHPSFEDECFMELNDIRKDSQNGSILGIGLVVFSIMFVFLMSVAQ